MLAAYPTTSGLYCLTERDGLILSWECPELAVFLQLCNLPTRFSASLTLKVSYVLHRWFMALFSKINNWHCLHLNESKTNGATSYCVE